MIQRFQYVFLSIALLVWASGCTVDPTPKSVSGTYRGVLQSPGGELAFPIHIQADGDSLRGFVVNGADTASFDKVNLKGDSLIMGYSYYDSFLKGEVQYDGSLSGKWTRRGEGGNYISMDFSAQKGVNYRYQTDAPESSYPFDGEWQATFRDDEKTFPAHGSFVSQPGGKLYGTFQTETGDYRFLDGAYSDSSFTLSTFDGPHAFLFKGRLQPDGSLKGDFWSKNSYHATWTAQKGENKLRNPLEVSADQAVGNKVTFSFPNLKGDTVSSSDPQFQNKPMLVYLFGSWCPNCADEAQMMRKLYAEEYSKSELKIVGLAFEYSGNFQQDVQMVNRYKDRFNIPWPLLIAGVSDKAQSAEQLSFLNQILSYPTSIFINRNHIIEAIHVGFNGPATGSAYYNEIQRYKEHINAIIQ